MTTIPAAAAPAEPASELGEYRMLGEPETPSAEPASSAARSAREAPTPGAIADRLWSCRYCGQSIPAKALKCPACGRWTADVEFAGFWRRFAAYFIDYLVLFAIGCLIAIPFGVLKALQGIQPNAPNPGAELLLNGISLMIGWLYFALQESSSAQATLGKRALGLVVTDLDGKPISFGKATGRFFGKILSGLICLIGYIMAGFTEKKQALHDMIAGTLVFKLL